MNAEGVKMKSRIAAALWMLAAVACSAAPMPLVKGGRSAAQIVMPELADAFHGVPPDKIKVDYLNVSLADNGLMCKCERCMAPFTCENGVVVQPGDPAFRPARATTPRPRRGTSPACRRGSSRACGGTPSKTSTR